MDEAVFEETSQLLTRGGYTVARLRSGEAALTDLRRRPPSLVLLDAELSDMSGVAACFEMREQVGPRLPIVLLCDERTGSKERVAGLLIGADDVVTRPFDPDELLARIRRLVSHAPNDGRVADLPLTGREIEVLQLLASGHNQDRIAEELFISPKTVGTHIQRILKKLGVHSRTEAVSIAFRHGLVEAERPPA
jgi:DNA-binding NarL/FixJ family response regulator